MKKNRLVSESTSEKLVDGDQDRKEGKAKAGKPFHVFIHFIQSFIQRFKKLFV